jgi:hypothetical protein
MKSVQVMPTHRPGQFIVDVVCDCGKNGMTDVETLIWSHNHPVRIAPDQHPLVLECSCGKKHEIRPLETHISVTSLS